MTASENQIVVYQPNETVRLDVRLENETVWLTQEQMALLFGRGQSVIARHVGNIFKKGELNRDSVYAKNAYTASDGKTYQVAFNNLDVVISVGYRVKSVQGTHFRQRATITRGRHAKWRKFGNSGLMTSLNKGRRKNLFA